MDVLKSVKQTLNALVPAPARIFVGVSGGLDSIVLLDILSQVFVPESITLLHIHHHIQKEADAWVPFVESLAQKYRCAIEIEHLNPAKFKGENLEGKAREGRYAFFEKHLVSPSDYLFLAHHQQDQIETFFLNLQRGAGLAGLCAMPAKRAFGAGFLVRPLLNCSRQNLEAYAKAHDLNWVEDPSNQDTQLNRNFLRKAALPKLRERWPHFDEHAAQAIMHLQEAREALDRYVEQDLSHISQGFTLQLSGLKDKADNHCKLLLQRWIKNQSGKILSDRQLEIIIQEVIGAGLDRQPLFEIPGLQIRRKGKNLEMFANFDQIKYNDQN